MNSPGQAAGAMPQIQRAACIAALLSVLASVLPAAAKGGPRETIRVSLAPQAGETAAQGAPFAFLARIANAGLEPAFVSVLFTLAPARSASPVDFESWAGTIQPDHVVRLHEDVVSSAWFADLGSFVIEASVEGHPASGARLSYTVARPPVTPPRFEDATARSGIEVAVARPGGCRWAAGAAWGDIDADGDLDLFVPATNGSSTLWVNDGAAHFTEQAAERGVAGNRPSIGAVFSDYDRDGDADLYVTNNAPNYLYRNDGTGRFIDVAVPAGVADDHQSFSASWGDYDADGWPDLYVTNYQNCHARDLYTSDVLYHNEGDGTFTHQTALLPPAGSTDGAGFQAGWLDYDGDGDQDLYLANDSLPEIIPGRNHLWRNDGPDGEGGWVFTDVSARSGTDFEINSMGLAIGDYDRDLDLDFAISNIAGNVLARNDGGTFTDEAATARVARPFVSPGRASVTWGMVFADLNLDGWEDLYVDAGALLVVEPQPNQVFVNGGAEGFFDLSAPSGADDPAPSKGLSLADFDRDGRMDLLVVDQGGRVHLFRNVTPYGGRHWLEVKLAGSVSNPDACGARLTFSTGGGRILREVFCGSVGLSGGSDPTVHVGLAASSVVDRLVIDWPSGARQIMSEVPADQVLTVFEPPLR